MFAWCFDLQAGVGVGGAAVCFGVIVIYLLVLGLVWDFASWLVGWFVGFRGWCWLI